MPDIRVRKVDFEFPDDVELYAFPTLPRVSLFIAAFSLTMPYLEPYLIRMMLKATDKVDDENLRDDIKRFSQQEGNHYRNHAKINNIIRSKFDEATALEISTIENNLKSDYDRFLKEKTLAFNLAYAEGFEAMTCAAVLGGVGVNNAARNRGMVSTGWDELLDWHGLEEVEHRTVAFDVYNHLVGSYFYRVVQGIKSQAHYLGYIHRFYRVMLKARGFGVYPYIPFFILAGGLRYINTFSPWYNPANYKIPDSMSERLEKYTAMAAN